jgi:hypothetical protein
MMIGTCDFCHNYYRLEEADLARSLCPDCRRPLRLTHEQEARQVRLPIRAFPAPPEPPDQTS